MDIKTMQSERFAEELFFLLMSSPLRDRVQTLGVKYGLSRKDLRDEIVLFGKGIGADLPVAADRTGGTEDTIGRQILNPKHEYLNKTEYKFPNIKTKSRFRRSGPTALRS